VVLEQVKAELLSYAGGGISVMELSHARPLSRASSSGRKPTSGPCWASGATTWCCSSRAAPPPVHRGSHEPPPAGHPRTTSSRDTRSKAALKEAGEAGGGPDRRLDRDSRFDHVPAPSEVKGDSKAAYLHFTSNNTIYGTEWFTEPRPPTVPLVCDASSDALSRPLDVSKYGLIYAGAQKNWAGGVTLVILRRDPVGPAAPGFPRCSITACWPRTNRSTNTPPCFAIYVVGLVLPLAARPRRPREIERRNVAKAESLYRAIDQSGGFYHGHARPESRSR